MDDAHHRHGHAVTRTIAMRQDIENAQGIYRIQKAYGGMLREIGGTVLARGAAPTESDTPSERHNSFPFVIAQVRNLVP